MKRLRAFPLLVICLLLAWLPLLPPAAAAPARQDATPPAKPAPKAADVKPLLAKMTVADKVGQLFLVTFQGSDVSANSDIATLIRDYRVGGVVLLPGNDNFRNVPVPAAPITTTQPATPTQTLSTPQQIGRLTNALQALAFTPPRPITATIAPAATAALTATATITPTATATITPTATPVPITSTVSVPLLIGLDWTGDDNSFFSGAGGFTPLPSAMALGATWSSALAEQTGQVVGQELRVVGINLLLGPTLDVLDAPRPGSRGDLDTRTFGGDPFWVGQLGQAFIRGVQTGGQAGVITAAKHFPGQGGADRRPEDEVATVQKSLQQLRQIELAPFVAVTAGSDLSAAGTTAILMTSHIRYRGLQGNIRQLTPPISLAPQLQDLMALKEFADWRMAGGVLVSDALGVPALRRYYDPALQKFPHRQVAQDAFLAGNDLLYLGRFALSDNWPDQFTAIKETILFFQSKYRDDSAFRARVDASVERILRLKSRIYGSLPAAAPQQNPVELTTKVGQGSSVTQAVARGGLTLIYPGREELADRLPSPTPGRCASARLATPNRSSRSTRCNRSCCACTGQPAQDN
jgi:beta-N-acetylhexosaminidase